MDSKSNSPTEAAHHSFGLDENNRSILSTDFSIQLEDLEDILLDGGRDSLIRSSEIVNDDLLSDATTAEEAASKRPSIVSYDGNMPSSPDEDEMCEEIARSILKSSVGSFSVPSADLEGGAEASGTPVAAASKWPSVVSHDGRTREDDDWCDDMTSSLNSISISSKDFLPECMRMELSHSTDTSEVPAVIPAKSPFPSPAPGKKKRRRRERVLDLSRAVEPTDDDVLFGRGGYANIHPGNRRFRQEALELWPTYDRSSKDEKQMIARRLVRSIKHSGGRFLERGKDGQWHEVVHGEHTKASQAFRDLHRQSR